MAKPGLTVTDFEREARRLGCEVATLRAVCHVEAPRGGFNPDDTPVTLFEGHKFYKHTGGKFATTDPDLCYQTWTRKHYGGTWQAEQKRLQRAMELDRPAALKSASWGRFQILGENFIDAGHPTLQSFVNAMYRDERGHLSAFVEVVRAWGLVTALRNRNFEAFARRYNGPGYAANGYHTKMQAAYAEFSK